MKPEQNRMLVWFIALVLCASNAMGELKDDVLERVRRATVLVLVHRSSDGRKVTTSASGFFVSEDGYVVTCRHAIAEKVRYEDWRGSQVTRQYDIERIQVVVNAGTPRVAGAPAEVVAEDRENDLAILKVSELPVREKLDFGDTGVLRETQSVWCFGYPLGEALAEGEHGPSITVAEGQITSLRRKKDRLQRIQTDVSVTQGNSGGPVVNSEGKVVGVIYLKVGRDTGLNMAIPASRARRLHYEVVQASLYRRAAEQGNAEAQYRLARCYVFGKGVKRNYKKHVEWCTKSAQQGYAEAEEWLIMLYSTDFRLPGHELDYEKAVKWIRKGAERGDTARQASLGGCYWHGKGVEQDYRKAAIWFTKAAEQGSPEAQFYLGVMYRQGQGVKKDPQKAFQWFQRAAEHGNSVHKFALGSCYASGCGVAPSAPKAAEWYKKSARADSEFVEVSVILAMFYARGQGVGRNQNKSIKWLRRAAEGCEYELSIYADMVGSFRDFERSFPDWVPSGAAPEAIQWCMKVAQQGSAEAQYTLGLSYIGGWLVEKDYEKAADWLRKAADQGHEEARKTLREYRQLIE